MQQIQQGHQHQEVEKPHCFTFTQVLVIVAKNRVRSVSRLATSRDDALSSTSSQLITAYRPADPICQRIGTTILCPK